MKKLILIFSTFFFTLLSAYSQEKQHFDYNSNFCANIGDTVDLESIDPDLSNKAVSVYQQYEHYGCQIHEIFGYEPMFVYVVGVKGRIAAFRAYYQYYDIMELEKMIGKFDNCTVKFGYNDVRGKKYRFVEVVPLISRKK